MSEILWTALDSVYSTAQYCTDRTHSVANSEFADLNARGASWSESCTDIAGPSRVATSASVWLIAARENEAGLCSVTANSWEAPTPT